MAKGFEFKGHKEIEDVLAALPQKFGAKVLNDTLKKSAKPLIEEAKNLVKKKSGELAKSIGSIPGRGKARGQQISVGPRRGGRYKGYHAHLVEYGTAMRKLDKPRLVTLNGKTVTITHTGSMPARPFMRPAYDAKIGAVQEEIKKEFRSILDSGFEKVFK
jgi:HK97 gp10 family phage protein